MSSFRLHFVDALRGVAILGVLAIHCGREIAELTPRLRSATDFGANGVQLFFVLSALTLMSVHARREFVARDFFTRRFFRIAPAFYLAGIYYVAVSGLGPTHSAPEGLHARHLIATALFLHGFWPDTVNSVVPGGWSIAVEATFYATFPLFLRYLTTFKRTLLASVGSFVLAALWARWVPSLFVGYEPQYLVSDLIFFGFIWNLPAFLLGVLVYQSLSAWQRMQRTAPRVAFAYVALGLSVVLLALAAIGVEPFSRRACIVPLLAAMVFTAGVTGTRLVNNAALRFLGEISFSVYLLHFAVIALLRVALLPGLHGLASAVQFSVLYAGVLGLSALLAYLSFRLVEKPGIELGRRLTTSSPAVVPVVASERRPRL